MFDRRCVRHDGLQQQPSESLHWANISREELRQSNDFSAEHYSLRL